MTRAGAILAGGEGRRMGGADKPSLMLDDRRLIDHVLDRLRPQADRIAVSANGDPSRYADLRLDIIADDPRYRAGPLAGIATMMSHFARQPEVTHLITVPADAPFIPQDLAERLNEAVSDSDDVAIAASAGRTHQIVALWPIAALPRLEAHLAQAGNLSIMAFLDTLSVRIVDFEPDTGIDPFLNVNTPADLDHARRLIAERRQS
ncbi:MAG: molybdenum cofactor guanylyltransferase MobA [Rhizobiales bacterium]|nr:molybdenum cofactor guanylyltransferase MobA [Hyphomicrobiales bacterium]MBA68681.1 molybdenum cofactor guanylyltransferase MobA [Hyphomicrobiales bacterium]|tara:strand:- start:983 stop:1597 length:615 start_codon:yes stop_codon:yes gene_type:complete